MNINDMTISQVDRLFRDNEVTRQEVVGYLINWNKDKSVLAYVGNTSIGISIPWVPVSAAERDMERGAKS